jgi:hypothetical protein
VEQMTGAMLEKGLISLDKDGLCHVSKELDLDTYTFSYSVEALITSRIDLLAPTQALVLKVSSQASLQASLDFQGTLMEMRQEVVLFMAQGAA